MTNSSLMPTLRYRDAAKAVEWLCDFFGFQRHMVYPGPNESIAHAQLTFANGMIMLGSVSNESEFGKHIRQPNEIGGFSTQGIYVVVADADAHYARAKAGGAKILIDIKDEDYGGRDYTCLDLEGHVWTFGSFDPWGGKD